MIAANKFQCYLVSTSQ